MKLHAERLSISHPPDNRSAGIMLIECLVYIAVLAVILGLALMAFYRVFDQTRNLARNAADIMRAVQAGERWREDIRQASAPIRIVTNDTRIELRIPCGDREVAYTFEQDNGTVHRQESSADPWESVLIEVKTSEMQSSPRQHVTAWRWDIELAGQQKVARVKPLFSFLAATATTNAPSL